MDFQPRRRILLRDSPRRGKRAVRTVKGEGEDPYSGMLRAYPAKLPRCETGIAPDESESRQHVACPVLVKP